MISTEKVDSLLDELERQSSGASDDVTMVIVRAKLHAAVQRWARDIVNAELERALGVPVFDEQPPEPKPAHEPLLTFDGFFARVRETKWNPTPSELLELLKNAKPAEPIGDSVRQSEPKPAQAESETEPPPVTQGRQRLGEIPAATSTVGESREAGEAAGGGAAHDLAALRRDAARYNWLAMRVLFADYGDNDTGEVGWRISLDLRDGKPFIFGKSIDAAVDAALHSSASPAAASPSLEFYVVVVKQDGFVCLGTQHPLSHKSAAKDAKLRGDMRSSTGQPLFEWARVGKVTVTAADDGSATGKCRHNMNASTCDTCWATDGSAAG